MISPPDLRIAEGAGAGGNTGTTVNPPRKLVAAAGIVSLLVIVAVMIAAGGYIDYPASDTTSYVDLATHLRAGNLRALTNAYWSPLYPILLSLTLPARASIESIRNALITVQVVIHGVYLASLLYFAGSLYRLRGRRGRLAAAAYCVTLLMGLALYLKFAVCYTPDGLVAATVTSALGIVLRLQGIGNGRFATPLGVVLGIAYWAKAIMFPASLILIALLVASRLWARQPLRPALTAVFVFLLTAAPAAVLASIGAQRVTFGETGRLNFAWFVNGYQLHRGWVGHEPGSGVPVHAPRVLIGQPLLLEFSDPDGGVFPLWYDPALWHRGVRTQFRPVEIASAVKKNLLQSGIFVLCLGLALPGLVLLFRGRGECVVNAGLGVCAAWPVVVWMLYLLVYVELRHIAGFAAVLVAVSLWPGAGEAGLGRRMRWAQMLAITLFSAWLLGTLPASTMRAAESSWSGEIAAARFLRQNGVGEGDRLAAAGRVDGSMLYLLPFRGQVVSWLRPGRLDQVSRLEWEAVLAEWRSLGVRAVVCLIGGGTSAAEEGGPPSWMEFRPIPGARNHYFRLVPGQP